MLIRMRQVLGVRADVLTAASSLGGAHLELRVAALEHCAVLAERWDFEGWEQRRAAEQDPPA